MTTDTQTDIAVSSEQTITRANPEQLAIALQHILATGDLSKLSPEGRVSMYLQQCSTLGLSPISRPFDWLILDGKLVLYPNKACAEQLRRLHQISIRVTRRDVIGSDTKEPMFVVEVEGRRPNGQVDQASKYVPLWGSRGRLSGRDLANAYAKAETGAKRRLTFSMIGMAAPPDELENARRVIVDGTGQIIENPTDMQRALAADPGMARIVHEPVYEDMAGELADSSGYVSQAPTIEELEPPRRPYQPPTRFHCDAQKWRSTWFMVVKGTFLDDDDARHDFIEWYTSGWPENRRTDSLTTFLQHATDRQAEQLINAARETIADRAQAEANDPDGELDGIDGVTDEDADREAVRQAGYEARPEALEDVRAAAILTGAPGPPTSNPTALRRPDDGKSYSPAEWRLFYVEHAARLRKLDTTFRPQDPDRLKGHALSAAVVEVIERADAIEEGFDALDEARASDQAGEQPEPELAF